ncbi:hypothetical protein J6590_073948 [Homalodisca vitripennis]|nr:hypothetical protein J6590_073948 [Homalodisca vitripennis]
MSFDLFGLRLLTTRAISTSPTGGRIIGNTGNHQLNDSHGNQQHVRDISTENDRRATRLQRHSSHKLTCTQKDINWMY